MMLPNWFSRRWKARRRGLARAVLRFDLPAWLPSSPAPASRRLPVMANHRGCSWRPQAGSNLLIANKFIRARPGVPPMRLRRLTMEHPRSGWVWEKRSVSFRESFLGFLWIPDC